MGPNYSSAMPTDETTLESAPSENPEPSALPTSGGECRYTNKCWGFYSFKWFNNGETSNGYTCNCGAWKKGS